MECDALSEYVKVIAVHKSHIEASRVGLTIAFWFWHAGFLGPPVLISALRSHLRSPTEIPYTVNALSTILGFLPPSQLALLSSIFFLSFSATISSPVSG